NSGLHGVSAVLQHGVQNLHVKALMILAHGGCGGINALRKGLPPEKDSRDFIGDWMQTVAAAKEKVSRYYRHLSDAEQQRLCEEEAVKISFRNVFTFPFIQKAIRERGMEVYCAHYESGIGFRVYHPQKDRFELAIPHKAAPASTVTTSSAVCCGSIQEAAI